MHDKEVIICAGSDAMTASEIVWPRKTRELRSAKFDSAVWNNFTYRDDDIVIATYEKAGTTWTQQIVSQLVFQGAADVAVQAISPWLDLRLPPAPEKLAMLDAQRHRRFVKTHLPVDAGLCAGGPISVCRTGRP
jgi:aryl sulfotransferase